MKLVLAKALNVLRYGCPRDEAGFCLMALDGFKKCYPLDGRCRATEEDKIEFISNIQIAQVH